MISFPNCKINLGLHVVNKRSDGFHNIETIFYPVTQLYDALEIIPSNAFSITTTGISVNIDPMQNICTKAYQLFANTYHIPPVQIYLHKNIPHGAGLGGGSADAAFTIKLLNTIFELNLNNEEIINYCRKLGSDCAFFVNNKPVYATEKGDVFTEINLDLSNYYIYLVKPNIFISTAEAYSNLTPKTPEYSLPKLIQCPISDWQNLLKNDFEESIFRNYPLLNEIKQQLYSQGAIYAAMSGSGSSIFGIFDNKSLLDSIQFDNMFTFKGKLTI